MSPVNQMGSLEAALSQAQGALEQSRQQGSEQRSRLLRRVDMLSHLVAIEARNAARDAAATQHG